MDITNFDFSNIGRKHKSCTSCKSESHTRPLCPDHPCSHCNAMGHVFSSCPLVKEKKRKTKLVQNMNTSKIEQQQERHLLGNMSSSQIEQQQVRHRMKNMSSSQIEQHNARNRIDALSSIQIEQQRESHRIDALSSIQIEQQRESHRMENMSSHQIVQQRESHRIDALSPSQIVQQRESHRIDALSSHQIVQQQERHRMEHMSPEQRRHHRESNRIMGNMSPEHRELLRQRNADRYRRFQPVQQTWDDENPCKFCFYVPLKSQRGRKGPSVCCNDGEYLKESSLYPKLQPLPEGLKKLCLTRGEHFGGLSAKYNNILCIGSTGVENAAGGGYEQVVGDHAVKMNGRSYHFLSKKASGGLSYFTFDGLAKAQEHATQLNLPLSEAQRAKAGMELGMLKGIFQELKDCNEFVQELGWIGDGLQKTLTPTDGFVPNAQNVRELTSSLNMQTSLMEVGCILSDESQGNIVYRFNLKGQGTQTISSSCDAVEPLCYTLLFPFGEKGWHKGLEDQVSFYSYMRSRFKMPERTYPSDFDPAPAADAVFDDNGDPVNSNPNNLLRQWTKCPTNPKLLATNRFQLMTRLSQYYQVEQLSRALDFRLNWFKNNQGYIFGKRAQYVCENDEDNNNNNLDEDGNAGCENENPAGDGSGGGEDGGAEGADNNNASSSSSSSSSKPKKIVLGPSFNGSPRHLNEMALNALEIVAEYGNPDFFITGTCNPMWPEIQDRLFPGQTAFDRPDVVVEVFHARLAAFMHNLRSGKYFGGKQTAYDIRVIEYQHRGLPHFHLVCKLKDMPKRDNIEETQHMIDQ